MDFSISESAAALRDAAGDVLDAQATPDVIRSAWDGDASGARKIWQQLGDVGVIGTLVSERAGGLGLGLNHAVPLLERIGRCGLPLPVVESLAVAPRLMAAVGDDRLPAVLSGELLVTAQLTGSDLVPYAGIADLVLLRTSDGMRLVRTSELELEDTPTVDSSRSMARLRAMPTTGRLITADEERIDAAFLRGVLGTAAMLNGVSAYMLDLTVAHVKTREQFGVPIGSFQAIKHHLANCKVALEFARPAALAAAWSGEPVDASMAKSLASDAARLIARLTLQSHGAIAYTTEYDHHLFAKRAWALAASWGSAQWHRERIAEHLGLTEGTS